MPIDCAQPNERIGGLCHNLCRSRRARWQHTTYGQPPESDSLPCSASSADRHPSAQPLPHPPRHRLIDLNEIRHRLIRERQGRQVAIGTELGCDRQRPTSLGAVAFGEQRPAGSVGLQRLTMLGREGCDTWGPWAQPTRAWM